MRDKRVSSLTIQRCRSRRIGSDQLMCRKCTEGEKLRLGFITAVAYAYLKIYYNTTVYLYSKAVAKISAVRSIDTVVLEFPMSVVTAKHRR